MFPQLECLVLVLISDFRKMLVYWSLEILTLAQPNTFDFGMILIATWTRERERERERERDEWASDQQREAQYEAQMWLLMI